MYSHNIPTAVRLLQGFQAPAVAAGSSVHAPPQQYVPAQQIPVAAAPGLDLMGTTTGLFDNILPRPLPTAGPSSMPLSYSVKAPDQCTRANQKGVDKDGRKSSDKKSGPAYLRKAAGKVWNDPSLLAWDENDHRVFCGDLGNEVTDETLANAFRHYSSFNRAKVIRDNRTGKTKGYGFVSFSKPEDMLAAMKEMNKKYVGNRPIRVIKSKWKIRDINSERNRAQASQCLIVPTNAKSLKKYKAINKEGKQQASSSRS